MNKRSAQILPPALLIGAIVVVAIIVAAAMRHHNASLSDPAAASTAPSTSTAGSPPSSPPSTPTPSSSPSRGGGVKRALIVGSNYPRTPSTLYGCINDDINMHKELLGKFGFLPANITVLNDDTRAKPTRANIIAAMKAFAQSARPGDHLYFHYSGHGGQLVDTNGDEKGGNGSGGMDSTLVPVDYARAGQIPDDEVKATLVDPLPSGATLLMVVDACHSGTVADLKYGYTDDVFRSLKEVDELFSASDIAVQARKEQLAKGLTGGGSSATTTDRRHRHTAAIAAAAQAYNPDEWLSFRPTSHIASPTSKSPKSAGRGLAPSSATTKGRRQVLVDARYADAAATVLCISGCRDRQTSADTVFDDQPQGAMTHAFLQGLDSVQPSGSLPIQELVKRVRAYLAMGGYDQVPVLTTSRPVDIAHTKMSEFL